MSVQLTIQEIAELEHLRSSDQQSRTEFFEQYREQLKNGAKSRLDARLRRRLNESDIIQEAFIKYISEVDDYLKKPSVPPLLWLRQMVRQLVWRTNRHHLGTKGRDARRELDQYMISPVHIDELAGSMSSVGSTLQRMDLRERIVKIVSNMPTLEREIVTLVHFEQLTIRQAAMELGIQLDAAKKRHRRGLNRLRKANETQLLELLH
jgi:RNA polymerase sigma-70 factor (ECF subfamily)